MDELLKRLQEKHGLSNEEALKILSTIVGYIKEQFPMVAGAVDNLFPLGDKASSEGESD